MDIIRCVRKRILSPPMDHPGTHYVKKYILRIGDTEFIVDQAVNSQQIQASCDVPWFTFITQKSIDDPSGNNLRADVELVDASHASDPRDKIFGVLGLVDLGEHHIVPEYTISSRHLVIGYYAYCLLAKKDICVMIEASRLRALEGMPSWAPSAQYDVSRNQHLIPHISNRQHDWLYKSKNFIDLYSRDHRPPPQYWEVHFNGVRDSESWDQRQCMKMACEWIPIQLGFESCCNSYAIIDSSTAAINLAAMHIMSFGSINFSETDIKRNGEVHMHILKARMSCMYLYANKCLLRPSDDRRRIHLSSFAAAPFTIALTNRVIRKISRKVQAGPNPEYACYNRSTMKPDSDFSLPLSLYAFILKTILRSSLTLPSPPRMPHIVVLNALE